MNQHVRFMPKVFNFVLQFLMKIPFNLPYNYRILSEEYSYDYI